MSTERYTRARQWEKGPLRYHSLRVLKRQLRAAYGPWEAWMVLWTR